MGVGHNGEGLKNCWNFRDVIYEYSQMSQKELFGVIVKEILRFNSNYNFKNLKLIIFFGGFKIIINMIPK